MRFTVGHRRFIKQEAESGKEDILVRVAALRRLPIRNGKVESDASIADFIGDREWYK